MLVTGSVVDKKEEGQNGTLSVSFTAMELKEYTVDFSLYSKTSKIQTVFGKHQKFRTARCLNSEH